MLPAACSHTPSVSEYLCIFAFVYFSAVPAWGVTYSRVHNESQQGSECGVGLEGGLQAAFSAQPRLVQLGFWPFAAPAPRWLTPDCYKDSGVVRLQQQSTYAGQTHSPRRLNTEIVSQRLVSPRVSLLLYLLLRDCNYLLLSAVLVQINLNILTWYTNTGRGAEWLDLLKVIIKEKMTSLTYLSANHGNSQLTFELLDIFSGTVVAYSCMKSLRWEGSPPPG